MTTVAIRYIDAFYSTKEKIESIKFTVHIAVGKFRVFDDHVVIIFKEEDNLPKEGMLIPKQALILKDNNKSKLDFDDLDLHSKKGSILGVFWKDIVYFEDGNIPEKCTTIYTEGELFSITFEAIVIKNPETIKIKTEEVRNHPENKPRFYIIPKSFIVDIEFYDK